jgi:predicted dehydrogenase
MRMRAVMVGCGAMSGVWLDAARRIDGLTVAGLVDIDVERARARATEFGLSDALIGTDAAEMMDRLGPDLLFDCVVPAARRDLALSGFGHGCHVLTEKPMADSIPHAREIIAAGKAAGRLHAVVQNRRYNPAVRRIRRFVESGAIGDVTSVHCDFFLAPHFGGFREEMEHVLLVDMAIHTFDAARYMAGATPLAVYCHEWEPKNSWYRQGSSAAAIFELSGGVVFTYAGSWCANGERTSWDSDWRIVGTKGSVLWDGEEGVTARIATERGEPGQRVLRAMEPVEVPPLDAEDRVGGHLGVMADFVAAVRNGGEPETRGEDNLKSLAMVFAAVESARLGRRVTIES